MNTKGFKQSAMTVLIVASGSLAFANMNKATDTFREMDTNGDGKISSAEHAAAAGMKFDKADKNKDGKLSSGELSSFMEEKGKSTGKAVSKSENKISEFDTNSDNVLTREEFVDGSAKKFTQLDVDADGSLSLAELEAMKNTQQSY